LERHARWAKLKEMAMSDPTTTSADQIGDGAKRVARGVNNGAHFAEDALKQGEDALKRSLEQSKAKLGDVADAAASRIEDAHAFITRQAREKPVQTTAIALGAGLLLGLFMSGGRKR
jgi:ElaB/YqjD/DUF883 family membrane-anchored ribosome-binding protein